MVTLGPMQNKEARDETELRPRVLKGVELLKFVRERTDLITEYELAAGAGYTETDSEGRAWVMKQRFYDALLHAQGLTNEPTDCQHVPTRKLSVTKSAIITIPATYTRLMGWEEHTELKVVLGADFLKLVPTGTYRTPSVKHSRPGARRENRRRGGE